MILILLLLSLLLRLSVYEASLKKEFGVKTNFKKMYYKISFDYHDIEETTHLCDKEYLKNLNDYSNSVRDDSEYSREDSIQIIENTYNQITSEDESGLYDKCLSLLNLIINQSAIVMYRLYNVALLNEEESKPFLTAPKVLFGGLNEKGEPDFKYSVRRYMYQIQFDIKFVENNF